jgi:uncharacterized protein involved in exopolysaccharide biosynthesis
MQQLPSKSTARAHTDQGMVASFTDVRPAAPKVEPASTSSIDVGAAIRKRPLLAPVILIMSLLSGAPYLLRQAPKEYHAEAAIYVSPTYFKNLQEDREQLQISYSTLVNQQILTLRRFDILSDALKRLEQQGIQWRKPRESEEAAVARLTKELNVQHIPDSYEVLVGLDGKERAWVAPIVNTVANAYLQKSEEEALAERSGRLAALTSEQAKIQAELQTKLDQQSSLSQQLMMVSLDKATPVDDTLLAGARQALEDARRRRMEAEAQLSIMESAKPGSSKNPLTSQAEETVTNDPNLRTLTNNLLQRRSELLGRIEGLTPQHPLRQATEKQLAEINDQLTRLPQTLVNDTSARMLVKLHSEVDRSQLIESELDQEVQIYASKVQARARQVQQAQGLTGDIERLRRDQSALTSRIGELKTGDSAPGYLRMFSAAQTPIEPVKTNAMKILGGLTGLALLLAIGLTVGMDLIDQRIVSPSEVKRAIGFPPVGLVLERTHGTMAFAEEHFRRLVNGIQRGMAAQDAKCIVVTPLKHARTPGSLVTDIGRALVERGFKTVIVDANPRRGEGDESTSPNNILPLDEPPPLSIKNASANLPARVEMGSPKGLDRVPVVARLGGLLEELKREYDVVLIDSPPLRLSADTEYLAAISDITLVVVETGKATRRDLSHGAALLGRIGAPSIGVIMSQVRLRYAGSALKRDFKQLSSLSWSTLPDGSKV